MTIYFKFIFFKCLHTWFWFCMFFLNHNQKMEVLICMTVTQKVITVMTIFASGIKWVRASILSLVFCNFAQPEVLNAVYWILKEIMGMSCRWAIMGLLFSEFMICMTASHNFHHFFFHWHQINRGPCRSVTMFFCYSLTSFHLQLFSEFLI